jgi:hypothetical protein
MNFAPLSTGINSKKQILHKVQLMTYFSKLKYTSLQGLSDCGTPTTSGTPTTVQWYTGLIRKSQRIKNPSINAIT